jgi:hypothetical protein
MHRIQNDPDILEADFDFPVKLLSRNDNVLLASTEEEETRTLEEEISPWGMEMINANRLEKGDHDILICMIDSGVAAGHPYFSSVRIDGEDSELYYRETWRWNYDRLGHGTKVAGILSALSEGTGLNLFVTRAVDDEGEGHESDTRAAVKQCVDAGANIINISMGGHWVSSRSRQYYRQVVEDMGIMMIAAAGNDDSDDLVYPASDPNVISVAAVNQSGDRWRYSNYGSQVELAAPGTRIFTTTTGVSTSTLEVPDGHVVEGHHIGGTSTENVASKLVYCGYGQGNCNGAEDNICFDVPIQYQAKPGVHVGGLRAIRWCGCHYFWRQRCQQLERIFLLRHIHSSDGCRLGRWMGPHA